MLALTLLIVPSMISGPKPADANDAPAPLGLVTARDKELWGWGI